MVTTLTEQQRETLGSMAAEMYVDAVHAGLDEGEAFTEAQDWLSHALRRPTTVIRVVG